MARLPITTKRREIDVRVVLGQSIFDLYQQIQILLQRECPDLANFFAEPLVNAVRGEINWNTRAIGTIKPATQFSTDEWKNALEILKKNTDSINELIAKIEKSGRGITSGTETLRSMLITPDLSKSLFQVGSEFVIAQWGCYEFGSDANNSDLFDQIDRQPTEQFVQASPIENEPSLDKEVLTPPPPPSSNPLTSNTPKSENFKEAEQIKNLEAIAPEPAIEKEYEYKEPFQWRWLILLLLLLLLLLGIFLKFRSEYLSNQEESLRTEVAKLWTELDSKIQNCTNATENRNSAPVTNEEFKNRQSENQINTAAKVNISLAWNDKSDLDLIVKQPDGNIVSFKPCEASTCGALDVDANLCDPKSTCTNLTDRPLENISWRGKMEPGIYQVFIRLYSINRPTNQIKSLPYTIQITQDNISRSIPGVIKVEDIKCEERCGTSIIFVSDFTVRK